MEPAFHAETSCSLQDHGAPRQGVAVKEVVKEGNAIDVSVAERDLAAGELALRIPDHLVITLSRVFEDEVPPCAAATGVVMHAALPDEGSVRMQSLAELLTSDKLSELACLTLYLMYEKKNGKQSVWYEFIKVTLPALLVHMHLPSSLFEAE